jgi:tetratricopeptide (TPR) repeat protein
VETDAGEQTRFVQAGSGFLAQHSKEIFFGLGKQKGPVKASVRWPSGLVQDLGNLPLNQRISVEEGSLPSKMKPFRAFSNEAADHGEAPNEHASSAATGNALDSVETWLLVPVAAPDFSVADVNGKVQALSAHQDGPTVLYFWTTASATCKQELQGFQESAARWRKEGLSVIAVNTDDAGTSLEPYKGLPFPVMRASADTLAIYNILFRSLFDRHRDMALPCSFLIDPKGSIVKIYQDAAPHEQIERDARAIPQNPAERMAKALPFPGVVGSYDFGRNYLSYGSLFFERGYPEQAEAFFQLVLRDDPASSEAYYGLASVYLQRQNLEQARKGFERAVQLHPSYPGTLPRAWNNLGILAARQGHTDEAISNFLQSLKIDPNYAVALDNLGSAYRQAKQWENAKSTFGRALALNAEDPEANYGMGMVYAQLDDAGQTYTYLQKALAARPVYPEALNNLGVLYLRTQRPQEAEKSFQESIRVAPAFDQSYLNLARLYSMEGDPGRARAVLEDLLKQHPGHPQAESLLSQLPQ